MKLFESILKSNSLQILLLNVFITFIIFFQNVICVRILTAKEYGTVVVALTFITTFQNIVGMRTGEYVLKYVSRNESDENVWIKLYSILKIDLYISISLFVAVLAFGYLLKSFFNIKYILLFVLSFNIFFSIGTPIYENIFIVYDKVLQQYNVRAFHSILSFLFVSSFTFFWGLSGYLAGLLSTTLLKNLIFYFFSKKYIQKNIFKRPAQNTIELKGLWQFSKHSYLSTTLKSGISGLDIILLSISVAPENVANYKIAKNLAMIPGTFLGALWSSIQPRILYYSKEFRYINLFRLISKFTKLFLFAFILIMAVLIFFSNDLIVMVYGDEYAMAYLPFLILFTGFWLAYSFGPFGRTYYLGQDRMHMMTVLNGVTFLIIITIGYFFRHSISHMAWVAISGLLITSVTVYIEIAFKFLKQKRALS